jgi:hypothetical protein
MLLWNADAMQTDSDSTYFNEIKTQTKMSQSEVRAGMFRCALFVVHLKTVSVAQIT